METEYRNRYVLFGNGCVYATIDGIRYNFIRNNGFNYPDAIDKTQFHDVEDYAESLGKSIRLSIDYQTDYITAVMVD